MVLIGIAASSSFQTNREVTLRPGQSTTIDGRKITYERPTVSVNNQAIAFGAHSRDRRARTRFTAQTDPPLLPPDRRGARATIGSRFAGEAESRCRPEGRPAQRLLDRGRPDIGARQAAGAGGRSGLQGLRRRRPRDAAGQCNALAAMMRAAAAEPDPASAAAARIEGLQPATAARIAQGYPRNRAPADLQGDRQPAGQLDLDRGADRPARRDRRALAVAPRAAASPGGDRSSKRSRKPSTARSATPNSITPPASSPTRTSRSSTRSCAKRRSRSSTVEATGTATAATTRRR